MITIIFGTPGCGKSTLMASVVQINKIKRDKYYKKYSNRKLFKYLDRKKNESTELLSSRKILLMIKYYKRLRFKQKLKLRWILLKCNIPIALFNMFYKKNFYDYIYCTDDTMQDTIYVDYTDWGQFKPMWNSLLLGEEAGIGLDSRNWSKLGQYSKRFAAMHRHTGCDILLVSQTCDVDKVYRQRAETMFHATKLGPFTFLRRIVYSVDVDEQTHQLMDMYKKLPLLQWILELIGSVSKKRRFAKERWRKSYFIYRPKWYKYFDSYVDNFDYPKPDPYFAYIEQLEQKENEDDEEFQKY